MRLVGGFRKTSPAVNGKTLTLLNVVLSKLMHIAFF